MRAYFYRLEALGVLCLNRVKIEKDYSYKWVLTKKGKEIIEENSALKELLAQKRIKEFCEKIIHSWITALVTWHVSAVIQIETAK